MKKQLLGLFIFLITISLFMISCNQNDKSNETIYNYLIALKNQSFSEIETYLAPSVIEIIKPGEILDADMSQEVREAYEKAIFNDMNFSCRPYSV